MSALLAIATGAMLTAQDVLDSVDLEPPADATEVLVLGTPHLRVLGAALEPASLDRLIEVLAKWQPDAICIESIPAAQLARMELDKSYAPVFARFGERTAHAGRAMQEHLGISRLEAVVAVREVLAEGVDDAMTRGHLVGLMVAAYEFQSALLHWSILSKAERAEAEMPAGVRSRLNARVVDPNERMTIAARLARELGHSRLFSIDDHLDKATFLRTADTFSAELDQSAALAELRKDTFYADSEKHLRAQLAAGDLLPHYLELNARSHGKRDIELQWGLFLRTALPSRLDRSRLHTWQARNLRMSAHVAEVAAQHPGGKVLVVVGAAHKPFMDSMLARGIGEIRVRHLAEL